MMLEIAPHLYELATDEEKNILENKFDIKPFELGTISLERIFIDKVFASEYYYERNMYIDFCKHIYDITVMYKLPEIKALFNDKGHLNYLIGLKRIEELSRSGGVSTELNISDFEYLNNIDFYICEKFTKSLNYIHNTYVFDENDKIEVHDIQETLLQIKRIFYMMEDEKIKREMLKKAEI